MAVQESAADGCAVEQTTKRRLTRSRRQMLWFLFFQSPVILGLIFSRSSRSWRAHHFPDNYDGISIPTTKFIGLNNYTRIADGQAGWILLAARSSSC
jgi:hypothetical protein